VAPGVAALPLMGVALSLVKMRLRRTRFITVVKWSAALACTAVLIYLPVFARNTAIGVRERAEAPPHFYGVLFPWQVRTAEVDRGRVAAWP
jgi:hypothetical protein